MNGIYQYIDVSKTIADNGSSVIVNGKISAPPVVGPKPGNTPSTNPNKVPKNKTINNFELNKGAIINKKLSILIIIKVCYNSWRKP